ncbi:MAG: acyltransferase [Firmicutes bacterium]|nr:acyltransferase [Bacillota bacterium]
MRKLYLDNIRWMTVVIVVIYHVIYMFNGVQPFGVIGPFQPVQFQDAFQYLVYPWFMALLFVISGMSTKYYLDNHSTKQFIKDKTRKLLVPSTIGLFVFQWILGYYNMLIGGGWLDMANIPKPVLYLIMSVSGIGVLWYIQLLWIFSMLLIGIRKIEKNRLLNQGKNTPVWMIVLFMVLVYGFAQILNTPIVTVYRFGIYGFCYFVGYFCFSHDEVMDRLEKYYVYFDVVAIVLGISYTVCYFGENYAIEPVINNVLACFYCWFAILGILTTMKKYGNVQNKFTIWMGKKSWGLYIFHYLPLAVSAYYLHIYAPQMNATLVYLLVALCSFAGAYGLNEIISRIPVLRWCVLGLRGEKKHV